MLGRTPKELMLVYKWLSALVSNSLLKTGATLVSVIKRPKTRTFLGQFQILQSSVLKVRRAAV